jgi:uncharacterized damage-inducible protein DinB
MSTIGFIKRGLDFAHKALADARNGSDEQLHFVPPNGSHSIAWCLWHTTRVEDLIINARILKQPMIWNGEWAERTGLPAEGFGAGQPDDDAQKVHIDDMDAFAAYQEAVWAATAQFLDTATDADLEREVPSGPARNPWARRSHCTCWGTSTGTGARSIRSAGCKACRP